MAVVALTDDGWILDHSGAIRFTIKERSETNIHVTEDHLEQCDLACPGTHIAEFSGRDERLAPVDAMLVTFRLKEDLFRVLTPFRMDSQCKGDKQTEKFQDEGTERRKRKRKRKEPLNIGEVEMEEYHSTVRGIISPAYVTLTTVARSCGYFIVQSSSAEDNNQRARLASQIAGPSSVLATMCGEEHTRVDMHVNICDMFPDINLDETGCVNTVLKHAGDLSIVASLQSHKFIIPPRCTFLLSDIQYLNHACHALGKFDLILMDPPWENKSVKRKKGYNSMDNSRLLTLPLGSLMRRGCVVAVWVTNRQKHIRFITQRLFPMYGIEYIARWHWLKVTTAGEMVYDLDSAHKKPYETLIFGRHKAAPSDDLAFVRNKSNIDSHVESIFCCPHTNRTRGAQCTKDGVNINISNRSGGTDQPLNSDSNKPIHVQNTATNRPAFACSHGDENIPTMSDHTTSKFDESPNTFVCGCTTQSPIQYGHDARGQDCTCRSHGNLVTEVPDNKVVVSVPCSLHSKKPPLAVLLRDYLPSDPQCLELFARNLTEGWTSWGNEVLQHQHVDFYERIT